jgi:hypothetical protein
MRSMPRKFAVAVVLVMTFAAGAALAYAQTQSKRSPIRFGTNLRGAAAQVAPLVLSGPDLGFRVEAQKDKSVVGRFVVRINGQWLDVETGFAPKVLTTEP